MFWSQNLREAFPFSATCCNGFSLLFKTEQMILNGQITVKGSLNFFLTQVKHRWPKVWSVYNFTQEVSEMYKAFTPGLICLAMQWKKEHRKEWTRNLILSSFALATWSLENFSA